MRRPESKVNPSFTIGKTAIPSLSIWGVGNWSPEHDINMRQLTPFLHLPSLKSLKITCLGDDYHDPWSSYVSKMDNLSMPYPKRTSPIESIVIGTAHITMNGLRKVLGACKNLKAFRAEFVDADESLVRPPSWSILLAECLLDHKSSLEEIDLPMYDHDSTWITSQASSEEGPEELVECFQKFIKLRKLSIPVSINYFGAANYYEREWITPDRLSKSIQYLKFYDSLTPILKECRFGKSAFVTEIGKALGLVTSIVAETGERGRLSQLKYIDCAAVVCDDPEIKWVEELKEMAKERGVQVLLGDYVSVEDAWQEACRSFGLWPG